MRGESSKVESQLIEQIRNAPELLQAYVRELERQHDRAVILRELVYAREEKKALAAALAACRR